MQTETKSRILLTVILCPFFVLALYWLFGPYQLWGILVALFALAVLFWIWKPVLFKSETKSEK